MEHINLTHLQKLIKTSIEANFDSAYWVTAEINEIKVNAAGHCYIEFVQKSEKTDYLEAKMSAVIWASMFRLLKSFFETTTGRSLESGIKVLVKAYVQYHELYGLSLNIIDIDPSYTVGSIEIQRQQTIARLKDEGVFDMNRELDFPLLPQRIAVISSQQAAGYQDFMQHLNRNEYGYKYTTRLFTATLQGRDAEKSIINALDNVYNQINEFDVVVVIRGGGSQADLSSFDSYRLAYHVAQFPLPVLTGIGHDKDVSITDMVAHQMLKTPTAVASFLISCITEQETVLMEYAEQLDNILQSVVSDEINKLNLLTSRIRSVIQNNVAREQMRLDNWYPKQIATASQYLIKSQQQIIDKLAVKVELNNPFAILQKGYSLTIYNGKPVSSVNQLNEDAEIETIFADGKIKSHITSIN